MNNSIPNNYLNPKYAQPGDRNSELAIEFNQFLAENIPFSIDSFGGDYAWSAPIPDRDKWESEVSDLVKHLNKNWNG